MFSDRFIYFAFLIFLLIGATIPLIYYSGCFVPSDNQDLRDEIRTLKIKIQQIQEKLIVTTNNCNTSNTTISSASLANIPNSNISQPQNLSQPQELSQSQPQNFDIPENNLPSLPNDNLSNIQPQNLSQPQELSQSQPQNFDIPENNLPSLPNDNLSNILPQNLSQPQELSQSQPQNFDIPNLSQPQNFDIPENNLPSLPNDNLSNDDPVLTNFQHSDIATLKKVCNLTPTQTQQIEAILQQVENNSDTLGNDLFIREQIESLLNSTQKKFYWKYLSNAHCRF